MPSQASNPLSPTTDWWELTSFDAQPVSLLGWRFNDNTGGLSDPFTLSTPLTILPGESVVFVEGLSASQFIAWWGANNLPADLKVVSYTGSGLGLSATSDALRLWDDTTTDVANTMASVDFGAATAGRSFTYNPSTQQFGELSQAGVYGAFRAANSSDVGSPGRFRQPVSAPVLRAFVNNARFFVEFETTAGYLYSLEERAGFTQSTQSAWTPTGDTLLGTGARAGFSKPPGSSNQYYRVKVE